MFWDRFYALMSYIFTTVDMFCKNKERLYRNLKSISTNMMNRSYEGQWFGHYWFELLKINIDLEHQAESVRLKENTEYPKFQQGQEYNQVSVWCSKSMLIFNNSNQ